MVIIMKAINFIIEAIGIIISFVFMIFPPSPFQFVCEIDSVWLDAINWIFPIKEVIAHLELFIIAVVAYYGVRIIARWIKIVDS